MSKAINYTQPQHNFFVYAAPFPEQANRMQIIEQQPLRDFNLDGEVVQARTIDYLDFPVSAISDFHAQWAYGKTGKELADQLMERWPQLKPDSRIVFYLFEIIKN